MQGKLMNDRNIYCINQIMETVWIIPFRINHRTMIQLLLMVYFQLRIHATTEREIRDANDINDTLSIYCINNKNNIEIK